MPLSYSATSEKIWYVSDLLTGRVDVWHCANQYKRLPNEQTKCLEWDSYGRFKNEFMEGHRNHHEQRESKVTILKNYQRKGKRMVDYISLYRAHQLIACLSKEALWEHLVNSIQPEVRTQNIPTNTDKNILDKVPTCVEMSFHTIANAGSTLEYDWGRETYAWTEFQYKVCAACWTKEKKEANKASEATKKDNTKRVLKKKSKPKSQRTSAKSDKSDTTKKAKELAEELLTYTMKKARMASLQCIKCGDHNHIKKDCTNAWDPTKEQKKKADKGKEKAAKMSVIRVIVDVASKPVSYGCIISEDKLDLEVDELGTQQERGLSSTSSQAVSQNWFSICIVRKGISVKEWKQEHEGELMDIDPDLISSVSRNLSISQKTETVEKGKVEDEFPTLDSPLEKRI